jgi:hypothetical protein
MKTSAEKFFFDCAGFSYNPATETKLAGRNRCARNLATAEAWARNAGISFEWCESDIDSSDFSDARPRWSLYDCIARDASGQVIGSLSGCDFGRDASGPYGDYRRVVEAEIALEAMPTAQTS